MNNIKFIIYLMVALLLPSTLTAATYTLTKGVWASATSVDQATGKGGDFSIDANNTYIITGNVSIEGQITIKSGYTVTIQGSEQSGSSEVYYRIWNKIPTYDSSKVKKCMIKVEAGATLIIDKVNINGNAHLSWDSANKTLYWDSSDSGAADEGARVLYYGGIRVEGTMTMTNCIIHDIITYCDLQNIDRGFNSTYTRTEGDVRSAGGYGAITVTGHTSGKVNISNTRIYDCRAHHGPALIVHGQNSGVGDIYLTNCDIYHNYNTNVQNNNWCGIIRTWGSCYSSIYLTNTKVRDNASAGECAGVYWNGRGTMYFDGCSVYGNYCAMAGGGMRLEATVKFQNNVTKVYNNKSDVLGGGIHFYSYAGSNYTDSGAVNFQYDMNQYLEVYGNTAPRGAGIAFDFNEEAKLDVGSTFSANFSGANIHDNTASEVGGGIFASNTTLPEKNYTVTINLNSGNISNNTAPYGAGLAVNKADITANDAANTITISDNIATQNGGGVYLSDGTISLIEALISNNKANLGAGLYVEGSSAMSSTFSGGTFYNNTASLSGGGFAVSGSGVTINLDDVDIQNNSAPAGGGVYVGNGAILNFAKGLIRANKAVGTSSVTTGYGLDLANLKGFGGGILVDDNSTMNFSLSSGVLGIYNNVADMGADDIFATGDGTSVNLPKVSTMTLTDFSAPVGRLYWVEDYMVGDTGYANGTNKINDGGGVQRYRTALAAGSDRYFVMDESTDWSGTNFSLNNKYLSLALGYTLLYITIEKSGMQGNDNAIFTITKKGETTPYVTVVLSAANPLNGVVTAEDGTKTLSKRVSVQEGEWTVQEVDAWTWAYQNNTGAITRSISSLTDPADRIFRFSNTKTADIPHSEAIKINTLKN
ncbi:MAG: hypothetical protein ACI4AK_09770 [Lepagella sp.]